MSDKPSFTKTMMDTFKAQGPTTFAAEYRDLSYEDKLWFYVAFRDAGVTCTLPDPGKLSPESIRAIKDKYGITE